MNRGGKRRRDGRPQQPEAERSGGEPRGSVPTRGSRGSSERTSNQLGGDQVEGFHAVRELLRSGRRRIFEVLVVERASGAAEIETLAKSIGVRVRRIAAERLDAEARSEAPQGVLARVEPIEPVAVEELLAAPDAFLVAIDGVTDPGNLGAILRTAETAGVTGIVMPRHRAARLGPTALKAAAGAVEYLPIGSVSGVPAFLDQARRAGLWTVGLDAGGQTTVFDLAVADGPLVVVLGAEGAGLSRLTRDRCDVIASIPLHGRLESLNVSAAAAVALHAVAERRRSR